MQQPPAKKNRWANSVENKQELWTMKLKLKLEDLAVESFDTVAASPERGTVRGHEDDTNACRTMFVDPSCDLYTVCYTRDPTINCNTCWGSCQPTCANTCDDFTCNCTEGGGTGTQVLTCQGPNCAGDTGGGETDTSVYPCGWQTA